MKEITLTNFRQYIGTQKIKFSTDKEKNVTVLIGKNTSGKTTLVRAFEWILYGKTKFDDQILLNQNVIKNMSMGEIQKVTGILLLEHGGKEYEITRSYTYTCIGKDIVRKSMDSKEISYVQPDGQTKTKIESEFQANIERILPEALAGYFFFGGERVGSISSRPDIESSVKGLMGLDVLYNAMNHLHSVINKFKKGIDYSGNQNALNVQKNLDSKNEQLRLSENEQMTVQEQIDYFSGEKEKYAALLKSNEPTANAQKRREQLDILISTQKNQIEKKKDEFVAMFGKDSFAFFGMPLLKKAVLVLQDAEEETESVPDMNANTIDYIISRGVCICGTKIDKGSAAEQNLNAEKAKQPPESIGSLVRRYREQALLYMNSTDNYFDLVNNKYSDIRSSQRMLGFNRDEIDGLNKELAGKKDAEDLEIHYKNAQTQLNLYEKQKQTLIMNQGGYKRDITNFEQALDKLTSANVKNSRLTTCINYASETYEWIRDTYQEKELVVREKLEEKVNSNFKQMYHGSRTVIIDEKYKVKYYDVTTEESDGLKAVKSFAFIAGLVDLAKEALTDKEGLEYVVGPQYYPVVMDAPFSNVDEIHIEKICKILPSAAEQVIIAVMKKDWEQAESILTPYIGCSYKIIKDVDADGNDIETSTHIK